MIRLFRAAAVGCTLAVLLAGCDATHRDSDTSKVDHAPATVIQFPDGFRNVAAKCDGPNMVYSGSAGANDDMPASVAVVPGDPRCKTP